jgi:hypothetical protein
MGQVTLRPFPEERGVIQKKPARASWNPPAVRIVSLYISHLK